jgi:hypothetical protein
MKILHHPSSGVKKLLRKEKIRFMERILTKNLIIAITLSEMELKTTERFAMMLDYILKFRK